MMESGLVTKRPVVFLQYEAFSQDNTNKQLGVEVFNCFLMCIHSVSSIKHMWDQQTRAKQWENALRFTLSGKQINIIMHEQQFWKIVGWTNKC